MCLIDFCNFLTIHVFGVKESIADISTELPCLGDLENPGWLPVQHVPGGTGDCVLQIFEISSPFMFLRSANHLMTFLLSYYVWETSKIQVTFWFKRFSRLPKHSFLNKKALNLWAVARTSQDGHTTNALLSTLLSCHVMSCHATSCHVTSCHVMPRHVASCYVMPRQVTSCYVMSRNFTSCHATSCHVLPRHVTSCHVT